MKALLLVDIQNDFLPGGALPVKEGDAIIPVVNELQEHFQVVVATQDWHPRNHGSFAVNHPGKQIFETIELHGLPQTLWPVHCVQGTSGADLPQSLAQKRISRIFQKGTDPAIDSYSGFYDNGHRRSTGMGEWLKGKGINEIFLCGLATDYCVKFTALDGLRLGLKVHLFENACRGVNLKAGDVQNALEEMEEAGVRIQKQAAIP